MNFIALDFETANRHRTSICAIGITVIRDGEVVQRVNELVQPYPNEYEYWNTKVHGITFEQTLGSPNFHSVWNSLEPLFQGAIIVAHNVAFDTGCLRAALDLYDIPYPNAHYFCSCVLSRKALPQLVNHRLSTVCAHFNVPLQHHDADSDAHGAAQIVLQTAAFHQLKSVAELCKFYKIKPRKL